VQEAICVLMSDKFEGDSSFDGDDLPPKRSEILREKLKTNLLNKIHEVSARDFKKHQNYAQEFEIVVNEMKENEAYLLERGQTLLQEVKKDQESYSIDMTFLRTGSGKAVF